LGTRRDGAAIVQDNWQIETFVVGDLATNCYLVTEADTQETAVIDPGGLSSELDDALRERKVRWIILTHGHSDHISKTAEVVQRTGAQVALHKSDLELYRDPVKNLTAMTGGADQMPEIDRVLEHGDEIRVGERILSVHHTPGHTPGCISLTDDGVAFTGDTLFSGSIGRTDLPGGSHEAIVASLRHLVQTLDPDDTIYPGHGPRTSLTQERGVNPYLPDF